MLGELRVSRVKTDVYDDTVRMAGVSGPSVEYLLVLDLLSPNPTTDSDRLTM